eukprot:CAMPEP_0201509876 /NCGR_PEP_ID=MMETSP0161_2-20130828/2804_1 /ASSEMBLY_ACC=CAM_ASM_000251 /TAXON_ID=180227 /ORGANISM="Neoparamoeba aestuarina, Strain SoJaBio B1-5/56/2" /LENGTH=107 /DNA_ID=CAMNT_0047904965 /DNA_START=36 /DNA_END=359 /DNA_ORIENTATION=-
MNASAGHAEKLLASMSLKNSNFNLSEQITKIQNISLPEVLTHEEVKKIFLLPLQEAIREDTRVAAEANEKYDTLVEENDALKKTISKLEYRINHIFTNNTVTPKPME